MLNKVFYSSAERRQNVFELSDNDPIRHQATAVGCLVTKDQLIHSTTLTLRISDTTPTLSQRVWQVYGYPLGDREMFKDELSLGFGTVFLVTQRTILTAAHCVCVGETNRLDYNRLRTSAILFNFHKMKADEDKKEFEKRDLYTIDRVLNHRYERTSQDWCDWALIKLDRDVEGIEPLKIDFSPIQDLAALYMLGYPSGIYLKRTSGATVQKNSHPDHFECDLDAFGGNSGSPVFEQTSGQVIGILCAGNTDYIVDPHYQPGVSYCKPNTISASEVAIKGYEKCQRINRLDFLKDYLDFGLNQLNQAYADLKPGLNLQVSCESCTLLEWMGLAMGDFSIHQCAATHIPQCASCHQDRKLLTIALYNCQFSIEGKLVPPDDRTLQQTNQVEGQKAIVLEADGSFKWNYLIIQTT